VSSCPSKVMSGSTLKHVSPTLLNTLSIEEHLDKTPNEYIRWRYETGEDKESLVKISMAVTSEEEKLQKSSFKLRDPETGKDLKKTIDFLPGSRRVTKSGDYETRFMGM
jgi:elongation factor 3